MAKFDKVQLPDEQGARSKVLEQVRAEIDQLAKSPAGAKAVDQHGKVDVHLKSGSGKGGIQEQVQR